MFLNSEGVTLHEMTIYGNENNKYWIQISWLKRKNISKSQIKLAPGWERYLKKLNISKKY